MRKEIFGIAATMLLIGTMAITSCSDDCVFGYDEEWDDMIPRSEIPITKGDTSINLESAWRPYECQVKGLAHRIYGTENITLQQKKYLIALLEGNSGDAAIAAYYDNLMRDQTYYTNTSDIKNVLFFSGVAVNNQVQYDDGQWKNYHLEYPNTSQCSDITYGNSIADACGFGNNEVSFKGVGHIDNHFVSIIGYNPNRKPDSGGSFKTNDGWIKAEEFDIIMF